MIPRVPSAPMNNLVVSKPAEDLRARWRVLMTSPEGRTTVYGNRQWADSYSDQENQCVLHWGTIRLLRYHNGQHSLQRSRRQHFSNRFMTIWMRTAWTTSTHHAADSRTWTGIQLSNIYQKTIRCEMPDRTGKNNGMPAYMSWRSRNYCACLPFCRKVSLISIHPIPGWQTRSESASVVQLKTKMGWVSNGEERYMAHGPWISRILFMLDISTQIPPIELWMGVSAMAPAVDTDFNNKLTPR